MKLHLGCGKKYLEGYVNIDAKSPVADMQLDHLGKLPFDEESVEEIMAIHLLEHIWPQDVEDHLRHWCTLLQPKGKLILELPDLYKSAKNYIKAIDSGDHGDIQKMALWPIYGDNPDRNVYDCHKWGWTFKTLRYKLWEAGFNNVEEKPTEWHGKRQNRDMRIEATK